MAKDLRRDRPRCAATRLRSRSAAVLVAVMAVLLAGCGGGMHTQVRQPAATGASTRTTQVSAVATLRTTDGAVVRVPSARPSVLLFISLGCADCAESSQSMAQAARAARSAHDRATFLAVDLDPAVTASHVRDFLDSVGAKGLPVTLNSDGTLLHKYHVTVLSSVLIIDPAGKVVYRAVNPSAKAITKALTIVG
jgi:hypothetical protein